MIRVITGKVGAGKNLYAIQQIVRRAYAGRNVACNFRTMIENGRPLLHRILRRPVPVVRQIPSRPASSDLYSLGVGGPTEDEAGYLVLDEVGPLLNTRTWQKDGAERMRVIDWLLHSRKLRWDVDLIVQSEKLLDKQLRDAVIESKIIVKRLDRLRLLKLPLPKMHLAIERYGLDLNAPVAGREFFRGRHYYDCYDTSELLMGEGGACLPELGGASLTVPAGVTSPPCPVPDTDLQRFMRDVSLEFGLCRSVLD